jgi:hypothetical protein
MTLCKPLQYTNATNTKWSSLDECSGDLNKKILLVAISEKQSTTSSVVLPERSPSNQKNRPQNDDIDWQFLRALALTCAPHLSPTQYPSGSTHFLHAWSISRDVSFELCCVCLCSDAWTHVSMLALSSD